MDIQQFIEKEKQNLNRFGEYWKNKSFTNEGEYPEKLDSLEDWLEQFLYFVEKIKSQEEKASDLQSRVAGLHRGNVWMSEDFNEPLPEEFWLGD